jgi:hypothetical protein
MLAKQALYCLSHTASPFCSGYFGDGGLMNILPKLASHCNPPNLSPQVARIIGMSHRHPKRTGCLKISTVAILEQKILCWVGLSVHCMMFSSTPGFYPNVSLQDGWGQGIKLPCIENHYSRISSSKLDILDCSRIPVADL